MKKVFNLELMRISPVGESSLICPFLTDENIIKHNADYTTKEVTQEISLII